MAVEKDAAEGGNPYRPKPPLWQPSRDKPASRALFGFVALAVLALLTALVLGGESILFASDSEPDKVTVVRIDGVDPPNDTRAYYRYWVRLPDGAEARYTSPDVHRVGETILVMKSRGRITGRIHLSQPRAKREFPR